MQNGRAGVSKCFSLEILDEQCEGYHGKSPSVGPPHVPPEFYTLWTESFRLAGRSLAP